MESETRGTERLTYLVALVIVGLDQSIKWLVATHMAVGQAIPVWRGVLEMLYVQNRGAGFSILMNHQPFLVFVAFAVIVAIMFADRRYARNKPGLKIALGGLLGGAVGNLIDRIWHGYVIDYVYIKIINFPVFNLADSAIVVSVIYLIARTWFARSTDSPANEGQEPAPVSEEE